MAVNANALAFHILIRPIRLVSFLPLTTLRSMSSSSTTTSPPFPVPDGFKLHTENNAHILMSENEAFLNPVQEFNRDLSVACIRTWSEELNKAKDAKRAQARQKRASRAKEELAKKRQRGMSRSTLQKMVYSH